ncbi:MAG: hypothetical protein KBB39_04440 [Phycicoccus sp.]|nr:hypothetical protein [Phycicoccus sp.]
MQAELGSWLFISGLLGVVCATLIFSLILDGGPGLVPFLAVLGVSVVAWAVGSVGLGGLNVSFFGVILLAAAVVIGPGGAGLLGLIVGALAREGQPWRARVFNMGNAAAIGFVGGWAYRAAGGVVPEAGDAGRSLVAEMALPLLAATVAQVVVNVVLLAAIVRTATGVPLGVQLQRMLPATLLSYTGYGLLAFMLIVLWLPAGLGVFSLLMLLAPLLGARWAFLQYVEERAAQEETIELLVAAIETRKPTLAGHAERVAALSVRMGEHLGFSASSLSDIRRAGMLHDLGVVAAPSTTATTEPSGPLALLRGLPFLAPAAELVVDLSRPVPTTLDAAVVAAAHRYDELTQPAAGHELDRDSAVARLSREGAPDRVVDALVRTLARTPVGEGQR